MMIETQKEISYQTANPVESSTSLVKSKQKPGLCAAQAGRGGSCLSLLMLIGAIACCGHAGQAQAYLFNNLSDAINGSTNVSNTQWLAQGFSTTTTNFVLDEVALRLSDKRGDTTGNFEIQVWDAAGASGSPGAQVGSAIYTGLAENLPDASSLLTISGLSVTLGASTNYYLLARGTTLNSEGALQWDVTNGITSNAYASTNSGTSWVGPRSNNFIMSVSAVPEPSSYALMIGAAALGVVAARRRH